MSMAHSVGAHSANSRAEKVRQQSHLEALFELHLKAMKIPTWERNYRFLVKPRYELDFAWPDVRFAVEVQGRVHCIKSNFHRDIAKGAAAKLAGWEVLLVDRPSIAAGHAVRWVQALLLPRLFGTRTHSSQADVPVAAARALSSASETVVGGG